MFVQNLNSKQQSVLLFLAKEVASADGSLDELQFGMIDILKAQSNSDVNELTVSLDELSSLFTTEREKCSLLLELIGVAHANAEYHSNEKSLIAKYAKALSLSNEKLANLEKWVEKQFALSKEVENLLG
ncbi:Tellurite resistance protein TerB [Canicola haemoglobinophilus]|uniref:Tellurite resistance protein TerB n=1 Tax=Canicola haemoglobinophilus TaxID=733 RepID=A0AB38HAH8_9PAST|nr:DNA repair protein [Canicola haemoglobinophilus]STO55084.1 Tellurite resistance protein TerB [Canicola haemoglobinophilus]STO69345.1 Tellurite resistance protein TerB [Canicola haemoglobinophilus]